MRPPYDPGNFPVLLLGMDGWVTVGSKEGLVDLLQVPLGMGKCQGAVQTKSEIGVGTQTLPLATLRCEEDVPTMALASSSDPGSPPTVSLLSSGCLVLELRFFHLWSSCT